VRRGITVGILAYAEGEPIAWCSIAPRETYAALERYRALLEPSSHSYTGMGSPATFRRVGFLHVTPAWQDQLVVRHYVSQNR